MTTVAPKDTTMTVETAQRRLDAAQAALTGLRERNLADTAPPDAKEWAQAGLEAETAERALSRAEHQAAEQARLARAHRTRSHQDRVQLSGPTPPRRSTHGIRLISAWRTSSRPSASATRSLSRSSSGHAPPVRPGRGLRHTAHRRKTTPGSAGPKPAWTPPEGACSSTGNPKSPSRCTNCSTRRRPSAAGTWASSPVWPVSRPSRGSAAPCQYLRDAW